MKSSASTKLPAVVIPAYKTELNETEIIALRQCLKVLGRYPIYLLTSPGLDTSAYEQYGSFHKIIESKLIKTIATYNRLMLSIGFYRKFWAHEYILIYQLDCFVFEDQLEDWCRAGYDYIGAPWLDVPWMKDMPFKRYVGNGGLSLRKVRSTMLNLLLFFPRVWFWRHNEDIFFSFLIKKYNPWFKIPTLRRSLSFAFESAPDRCYKITHGRLPFGAHAWEKHNPEFWRPFVRDQGYDY